MSKTTPNKTVLYQSGGLTNHAQKLCEAAQTDPKNETTYAIATILVAAAASEAILSEYAFSEKPKIYKDKTFKKTGVPKKFKILTGAESSNLNWLWALRRAISHSEPDALRSTRHGESVNPESANRACDIIADLARVLWQTSLPTWFTKPTGITYDGS